MKNEAVVKKTIKDLRKTIIELFKKGAKKAGYILINLLKLLVENFGLIAIVSILVFCGSIMIEAKRTIDDLCNVVSSKIEEATILETEMKTSLSSNTKKISIDKVVIDSNNNGVKDSDDVVIDGKLFPFIKLEKGDTLLYLNEKRKNKEEQLPLAVGNENGDFNIIKTPSNYYYYARDFVKPLDDALFNKIFAEIKEKAPRE